MQKDLERAAEWYLNQIENPTIDAMYRDLELTLKHRKHALVHGDLEQIYRTFAYTEIIKAAICLVTEEDYETAFSKTALSHIRKHSEQEPEMFICRQCGNQYPASAYSIDAKTGTQSKFCIRCEKEIKQIHKTYKLLPTGKLTSRGAIICSA